jgi:diguanylate cyclase (GGDEF)-like protein
VTQISIEAVEAFIAEHRSALTFPDWLEREFEADRKARRLVRLNASTRELLVVYNLFLAADWFLTPDTFSLSLFLHFAIVTPWMIAAMWLFGRLPAFPRELVAASLPFLIAWQILFAYARSDSPGAVHYQSLVVLPILYANAVQRLPNRLASSVSIVIVSMHAGLVLLTGEITIAAACLSSAISAASAYTTLAANRLLERDERRNYLHRLRDRLQHEKTEIEARRDPLTGLANRRELQQRLDSLWATRSSEATIVGLVLLDIDHFKAYNDRYGHPAGDACLKRVASCVQAELRGAEDMAARYGGEEMVVVLPGADVGTSAAVAERIRRRLEGLGIPQELGGVNRVVTASFGAASAPIIAIKADELVAAADTALYAAKNNGRNQVFPPLMREADASSLNRVVTIKSAARYS